MGFLKRFFSIGSKKNKKTRPQISNPTALHHVGFPMPLRQAEEEHEVIATQLLRSASARYTAVSEAENASLPPLPHPVNELMINNLASEAASIASTSISQRGTYSVTVHHRTRHSSTEVPSTNRRQYDDMSSRNVDPDETGGNLLRLRSDPSVASLLELYDEHGRLPLEAFSSTPPEERAQNPRNGSTLRELLGNPSSMNSRGGKSDNSALEGDISWAERFLAETDSVSSASSFGLRTPNDPDARFPTPAIRINNDHDQTFSSDHDRSNNTINNPALSSMDVELSSNAEQSYQDDPSSFSLSAYQTSEPHTPQRASKIFGFLTEKKQPAVDGLDVDRSLPELPSCFSSPSDHNHGAQDLRSHFSDDTHSDIIPPSTKSSSRRSVIPSFSDTLASRFHFGSNPHKSEEPRTPLNPTFRFPHSQAEIAQSSDQPIYGTDNAGPVRDVKVLMNGPTKVIVTAPTPSENARHTPSKIPRGPRAYSNKRRSRSSSYRHSSRPMLGERSNTGSTDSNSVSSRTSDKFTAIPNRGRRTSSQISIVDASLPEIHPEPPTAKPAVKTAPSTRTSVRRSMEYGVLGKENTGNQMSLTARAPIPFTPVRGQSGGQSSLFRTAVHPGIFKPPMGMEPSPASSSELSPVGRQMMHNVRQQRMKTREGERGRRTSVRAGSTSSSRSAAMRV
ncbi:hypothetical protein HGRIS_004960 [Hohenbuehelia grisea]|uniref:Uncharacterized protein n=1 Tax=Hohenbuehelia grisea TaxID=104357 RepID=A0ABR3JDI9_9AGAR